MSENTKTLLATLIMAIICLIGMLAAAKGGEWDVMVPEMDRLDWTPLLATDSLPLGPAAVMDSATAGPIHTGEPTVKPVVLSHSYTSWGPCGCTMCLGQHLRNMHGKTAAELDRIGYQNWRSYHAAEHAQSKTLTQSPLVMRSPGATVQSQPVTSAGCGPGGCRPIRRLLGGWR